MTIERSSRGLEARADRDSRGGCGSREGVLRRAGWLDRRSRPRGQRRDPLRAGHAAGLGRARSRSGAGSRVAHRFAGSRSSSTTCTPRARCCSRAVSRSARSRTIRGARSCSSRTRTATAGRCSRCRSAAEAPQAAVASTPEASSWPARLWRYIAPSARAISSAPSSVPSQVATPTERPVRAGRLQPDSW